jgi:hypothetical protein
VAKQNMDEYFTDAEPAAPAVPAVPAVPVQGGDLPEKFRRNTGLAIDAAAKILTLDPNPESSNYGSELRAVAAASSAQINAQLKLEEAAIKRQRSDEDVMKLILSRIAAEEERLARQDREERGLPPLIEGEVSAPEPPKK